MKEVVATELSEDIEVIGPGRMLSDARKKMKLSVEQVAEKLNFRVCQVKEIESDIFNKDTPETYTRGYLLNYAKLVQVSSKDIISSYESLGVAKKQNAEMQSFSKITEKEAEHSRLMWISYLIIALLITLSVVYYFQDARNHQASESSEHVTEQANSVSSSQDTANEGTSTIVVMAGHDEVSPELINSPSIQASSDISETVDSSTSSLGDEQVESIAEAHELVALSEEASSASIDEALTIDAHAIFTFAGDCWVNIHDGLGERIAYGIKKAGYVMELNGTAPFTVTVGKPELVSITFNGNTVDMSNYNSGNIAKFTLPESE